MKIIAMPVAALCLSTSFFAVHAATERDLDSHVHGGAKLNIAADDQQLFIEFESPWVNLVGFEHEPSTDEQRVAVADAVQHLEKADGLFVFTGVECVLAESTVESSMEGEAHEGEAHEGEAHEGEAHEGEAHEGEAHEGEAHEGEAHEGEAHEGEAHDDHEGESHSAVIVSYVFDCVDMGKLDTLNVGLFEAWPGIDDIDVQLVGPTGQSAVELVPGSATLEVGSVL